MLALLAMYGVATAVIAALSGCKVRVAVGAGEDGPGVDFFLPEGGEGCPPVCLPDSLCGGEGTGSPLATAVSDRIRLAFPPCAPAAGS